MDGSGISYLSRGGHSNIHCSQSCDSASWLPIVKKDGVTLLLLYIQWVKQENVHVVNGYQLISSTVKQWTFLLVVKQSSSENDGQDFLSPVLAMT